MTNRLQILHPIRHNEREYGRGVYEIGVDIPEDLAKFFLAKMPHAARLYSPDIVNQPGVIKPVRATFPDPRDMAAAGTISSE